MIAKLVKITTGPGALLQLARRVPDPLLSAELQSDINKKLILTALCGRNTAEQIRTAHTAAAAAELRLTQVGIKIQ